MLAFEVRLNGKRVCVAGADDLGILSANISACGPLGSKAVPVRPDETIEIFYSVGGRTSRPNPEKDVNAHWKLIAPLQVGDLIQVKIVEIKKADRAKSRVKVARKPK